MTRPCEMPDCPHDATTATRFPGSDGPVDLCERHHREQLIALASDFPEEFFWFINGVR